MLVLTRKLNRSVIVHTSDGIIEIKLLKVERDRVKIGRASCRERV